jgi:D-alanyl-D-alanine carboxypeptidase
VALAGYATNPATSRTTAFAVLANDLPAKGHVEAVRASVDNAAAALAGCQ